MLATDIFNRITKAASVVSTVEITGDSFGGSRARYDDNIGGNIVDDLATMLRTNPEFKAWYKRLQVRANEEQDINKVRELELQLMYPFKAYSSTLQGKAKSDWEGSRNTYRDSDLNVNRGGVEGEDDDSTYTDASKGYSSNKMYTSDTQRYHTQQAMTSTSNAFRYTLESTGKYATSHEQNPADNVMTFQFLTKLIRETNKHYDPKVMTLLMALMLRWGINIPTYVNRRDVPPIWWKMVSYAHANGGISKVMINLRTFLEQFGLKRYGTSSPQLRELRNIMIRASDSKTVDEMFKTLTSPQSNNDYGHAGRAKDYFAIDLTAKHMNQIQKDWENMDESYKTHAIVICYITSLNSNINESFCKMMLAAMINYGSDIK